MSKPKQLLEFQADERLVDERGPTSERMRGADFDVGDTGVITVRQSPIARAVSRGTFTERQGEAAQKFYRHWYGAGMAGSTGSADPLKIFGTTTDFTKLFATEAAEGHAWIMRRALEAVRARQDASGHRGDHGASILYLVVCREIPFAEAGTAIGFQGTAAEVMARTIMRSALNILIEEWGL